MYMVTAALFAGLAIGAMALPSLLTRDATRLSQSQLDALAPFTEFASAAYCPPNKTAPWNCSSCSTPKIKDFQPKLVGGDGNAVQYYYVGYWPSENAVVVAHQGTNPFNLWVACQNSVSTDQPLRLSILTASPWLTLTLTALCEDRCADLTDLRFSQQNLNSTLFPGVPSDVFVHSGFADEHAKTGPIILDAVKTLLSSTGASAVVSIGHSLGGALAELDAMFFTLNLPGTQVLSITYGTPRVGNDKWAGLFDATVPHFIRVNNKKDPVPTLPPYQFLGFRHPHGEIHLAGKGEGYLCPGDDDMEDPQCTWKQVPTPFQGDVNDHLGPYEGIMIGTAYCN